ncbi:hypothetical protein FQN60_003831, partial [Etheostoma spectabile]
QWEVNYHQQHICAVKDSSVVIPCSFYYPDNQRVQSTAWGHEKYDIFNGPFNFDSKLNETKKRFQYIGDTNHNCSLKINQVEHNDTGKHTFRFTTNDKEGKWTGKDGSTLKVVDLSISVTKPNGNRTIKEGDSVNLTCRNGCDGDNLLSAFTWFKNGEPITEGPTLYLSNMSSTNSGNYTCSLKRHTAASSGVIHIDVEYSPKNTSVSVRPSMEADAGSNITLTCSSRANPPVENYTWVKIDDGDIMDVGKGPVFIPGDGGQLNRKRTRAPERSEECEEDIQNSVYANYPVFDNNQSQERIGCEEQTLELIYTTVDFHTERKMEQQVASHNDDEGVVYSTVCRKLLNPTYVETP